MSDANLPGRITEDRIAGIERQLSKALDQLSELPTLEQAKKLRETLEACEQISGELPTLEQAEELRKTLEACEDSNKGLPTLEEADKLYETLEACR